MDTRLNTIDRDLLEAERWAEREVSPDPNRLADDEDSQGSRLSRTITRTETRISGLAALELDRIHTYRLQHTVTLGSTRAPAPRDQWLPFGAGKPYPASLPDAEEYVVEFTGPEDPLHPHNWSLKKKYACFCI